MDKDELDSRNVLLTEWKATVSKVNNHLAALLRIVLQASGVFNHVLNLEKSLRESLEVQKLGLHFCILFQNDVLEFQKAVEEFRVEYCTVLAN